MLQAKDKLVLQAWEEHHLDRDRRPSPPSLAPAKGKAVAEAHERDRAVVGGAAAGKKADQVVRIQYLPQAHNGLPQARNGPGDAQPEAEKAGQLLLGQEQEPAARAQGDGRGRQSAQGDGRGDSIPAHIQLYVSEISGIAAESMGARGACQQSGLRNETLSATMSATMSDDATSARQLWSATASLSCATPSPSPAPRPHRMSVDWTPVPHAVSPMLSLGRAMGRYLPEAL